MLVLTQWLTIHIFLKLSLFNSFFIIVDNFELDLWLRPISRTMINLLERIVSLQTFSIDGHWIYSKICFGAPLSFFHRWIEISHCALGAHDVAVPLTFFHSSCRRVVFSKYFWSLWLLYLLSLCCSSCSLLRRLLRLLLFPNHLQLSNFLSLCLFFFSDTLRFFSFGCFHFQSLPMLLLWLLQFHLESCFFLSLNLFFRLCWNWTLLDYWWLMWQTDLFCNSRWTLIVGFLIVHC